MVYSESDEMVKLLLTVFYHDVVLRQSVLSPRGFQLASISGIQQSYILSNHDSFDNYGLSRRRRVAEINR